MKARLALASGFHRALPSALRAVAAAAAALALAGPAAGQPVQSFFSYTVPGVVKSPGQNGTNYVSDIVIANPGSAPANILFAFAPTMGGFPIVQVLPAGQSLTLKDAVASVFGAAQAVGAIQVTSDQPLIIRGRTYNTASTGTFGVALPVIATDRFLLQADTADSLWVTQSPDYRTNIAVVFPDSGGGDATVTLYDQSGNAMGQQAFSLTSAGLQQVSVGSFATGPLPVGRANILVTRGRAAGYAVVVDNVTGDGSLYSFEDLPEGPQDVLVNGVTRAGGQLGTFWRTDGRLYNPDPSADATVTVSWLPAGDSNPSPRTEQVAVPAGRIVDLPDILSAVFGLPAGSSGALRLQSDVPVAILCRTSNLDPTGQRPGTFGAQQRAVPLAAFLMSADAGAVVTGVNQSSAFRTNLGFAAGPDGASYALTLKNATGGTVGTQTGSLGAFGWTQPNVASLFPGAAIPDNAQVLVRVTSGSLDLYDSSIDNGSGDPVVTSLVRLPAAVPSSATIGPQGGSIQSSDGRLTLKVPAGALAQPVAFSIAPVATNDAPNGIGSAYDISPDGVTFAKPAQLVFGWASTEINGTGSGNLGLAVLNGSAWSAVGGASIDLLNGVFVIPVSSTSLSVNAASPLQALLAGGSRRVARFGAVRPDPPPPICVLAGQERVLKITYVSAGSASAPGQTPLSAAATQSDLTATWSVKGGGSLSTAPLSASYTAPASLPGVQPSLVNAVVKSSGRHRIKPIPVSFQLILYPRRGTLTVKLTAAVACSNPTIPFEFSVKDQFDFGFVINDDYNLSVAVLLSPNPDALTNPCVSWQGVTGACYGQKLVGYWSPSQMDVVAAVFDCRLHLIEFRLQGKTMKGPPWTGTCRDLQGGPSVTLPSEPLIDSIDLPTFMQFTDLISLTPFREDIGGVWSIVGELKFGGY
jgi:hypothetical protein